MAMHTAVSRPSSDRTIGVLFAWMTLLVLPPNASGQPGSNPPPQPFNFLPAGHFAFEFQDMHISLFSLIVGPAGDLTVFGAGTPFVNASGSCDLMTEMCTAMGAGGASFDAQFRLETGRVGKRSYGGRVPRRDWRGRPNLVVRLSTTNTAR